MRGSRPKWRHSWRWRPDTASDLVFLRSQSNAIRWFAHSSPGCQLTDERLNDPKSIRTPVTTGRSFRSDSARSSTAATESNVPPVIVRPAEPPILEHAAQWALTRSDRLAERFLKDADESFVRPQRGAASLSGQKRGRLKAISPCKYRWLRGLQTSARSCGERPRRWEPRSNLSHYLWNPADEDHGDNDPHRHERTEGLRPGS